jgi:hypothetical protein
MPGLCASVISVHQASSASTIPCLYSVDGRACVLWMELESIEPGHGGPGWLGSCLLSLDDVHGIGAEESASARTDVEGGGGRKAPGIMEIGSDDEDVLHILQT